MRALDIVISTIAFAIFYTPLNWFLNRSRFSWRNTAVAILGFCVVYALLEVLGFGQFLAQQIKFFFHTFRP
jgi:hypothetical protein